ncbi:HVO_2072 family ArtA-dependent S-layer glycoprotein [Haloarcula sebkhae]|uniref:Cell surface glycoprotein n=2 Tax=Haloarcula sebkhae TaxID=932660 RepID=A0A830F2W2_9EURY|nr:HVO_2072 family ArtA-dependent S-layer glycoprotein [Haloarcula sebkhae]GGK79122.1 major cell surface glycoprotein [Haloarcula sebkhae]
MTDTQQKIKAVLLTVLMVTSVFAATIAFSGAAAASERGAGDSYTTGPTDDYQGAADSAGNVGAGAVVFQGEDDIEGEFADGNGDTVGVGELQKVSGDNEGILLEAPIPQDQPTGRYTANPGVEGTEGVTLQTPRITDLEVQNSDEGDVTGSILQANNDETAEILVDYNYEEAEDLELTVEDEDGLEVTDEILADGASDTVNTNVNTEDHPNPAADGDRDESFDAGFTINPSNVDEGEYTITVEGVEDLDFGDASETATVEITTDQTASLSLDSDEVTQGENLGFDIENSPEGNFHAVVIEESEFRDSTSASNYAKIFRNVGDTSDRGLVGDDGDGTAVVDPSDADSLESVDYAYAIVEVDGGTGVGSVETQYLDDSSIDIDLYQASNGDYTDNNDNHVVANLVTDDDYETDDEQDFDVVEGDLTIDSPSGTYVTGSEVDVNGTASEGIDDVAIYARDNNDYELVEIDSEETISVDGDDTFSEEDISLSGGDLGGNDILGLPGTYRIGVVDVEDADSNSNGTVDDSLTTSEFNSGVSSAESLRVTDTELNGTFITYNGQISSDDNQIDVEGQAPGKDNLVVAFVDSRGNAVATDISVDDDDTFSEDDISISALSEGTVTAHIISSGRDNTFGDGVSGSSSGFASLIEDNYASGSSTGDQVRSRILENSVDDTASDDLIVNEQFRLADGLTTVESVNSPVEANGTIEVEGTTNRKPDDNTITVELLDDEDESVTVDSTDEWGSDGQWSVSLDLSDENVEPGNFTVEADDGDNTDRQSVQIVEAGSLEEEQPATDTPEPDTDTPEPDTDTPEPDTDTPEPDTDTPEPDTMTEEVTSEATGPGFTAAIALIALVAAALLAVRRDN